MINQYKLQHLVIVKIMENKHPNLYYHHLLNYNLLWKKNNKNRKKSRNRNRNKNKKEK